PIENPADEATSAMVVSWKPLEAKSFPARWRISAGGSGTPVPFSADSRQCPVRGHDERPFIFMNERSIMKKQP
ncbi:MAG TPA: hypothetical protein PK311_07495, partial [Syntrophales bacterium]|nr:hypothetical protein [Syntrophales bacterium]